MEYVVSDEYSGLDAGLQGTGTDRAGLEAYRVVLVVFEPQLRIVCARFAIRMSDDLSASGALKKRYVTNLNSRLVPPQTTTHFFCYSFEEPRVV